MKYIYYLWSEIDRGNCRLKGEVPTLSHFLFWYILLNIGTMKEIQLTQGKVALIDDEDFDLLSKFKWYARKDWKTYYALSHPPRNKKTQITVMMHNLIMRPDYGLEVDHIDRDGLNCQKYNLRVVTHQQNCMNQRLRLGRKYRGVSTSKKGYISAYIKIEGKHTHLGLFPTEELAAMAYDKAAKEYYGELANLNFKKQRTK